MLDVGGSSEQISQWKAADQVTPKFGKEAWDVRVCKPTHPPTPFWGVWDVGSWILVTDNTKYAVCMRAGLFRTLDKLQKMRATRFLSRFMSFRIV